MPFESALILSAIVLVFAGFAITLASVDRYARGYGPSRQSHAAG